MDVAECDEDKIPEGKDEDHIVFEAHIRYTLLEVLMTIYEFFGNPTFDLRDQVEVEQDEEFFRGLDSTQDNDG
jgi:hypothetical protein